MNAIKIIVAVVMLTFAVMYMSHSIGELSFSVIDSMLIK